MRGWPSTPTTIDAILSVFPKPINISLEIEIYFENVHGYIKLTTKSTTVFISFVRQTNIFSSSYIQIKPLLTLY